MTATCHELCFRGPRNGDRPLNDLLWNALSFPVRGPLGQPPIPAVESSTTVMLELSATPRHAKQIA